MWDVTYKAAGLITTTNIKISADAKTMTTVSTGKKPDGQDFVKRLTAQRVSGGPGLVGKWKSTKVDASPDSWDVGPNGDDGLTFEFGDSATECSVRFDNKDYPCTGPTGIPKGFTVSVQKTGARSIAFTVKADGKAISSDAINVSADRMTLNDENMPAATKEKTKAVYDKQ
jgi:hypothetical protein